MLADPGAHAAGDQTMVVPMPSGAAPPGASHPPSGSPGSYGPSGSSGSSDESTAPWSLVDEPDDDDDGGFTVAAPPPPPSWATSDQPPAGGAPGPGPGAGAAPGGFGSTPPPAFGQPPAFGEPPEGPSESIVPESWYARPRKPDAHGAEPEQRNEPAQWAPQPPPPPASGPAWGAGPAPDPHGQTAVYDAGTHPGGATRLDQPPVPVGAPMGPMDGSLGPAMGPSGHAHGYPPAEHSSGKASKPLLITVTALVVVAVVAVGLVLWPGGDDKPPAAKASPSPSNNTPVAQKQPISPAKQQAAKVNDLLNASADTRRQLARALNATSKCETLPTAIKGFQGVAQRRKNQLRRAQGLQLDKLKNGERMRVSLRQSFQASLEADLRLLSWANQARRKCRGKPRPDVSRAKGRMPAERKATIAKKQFVTLWNPVARATGHPPRAWNGL
ncbi:hypothetical protein ACFY4C_14465 [Actinomadura viridis]|uniref:hypothetical protein n=1 Tax=Actinomadura viridis TaxID=58110 RepID=UPI0036AB92CF